MSVVDEIKARIDIVGLIGETVELRRSGKNYVGFCPFHPNTRTPAFAVFPETGTWRCFGACNTGGDVFTFVMKKEGWDFRQALEYLAQRAGVPLKDRPEKGEGETATLTEWRQVLQEAVTFYQQLLRQPQGRAALEYLRSRGLSEETIEAFALGYAPRERDAFVRYMAQRGFNPQLLAEVGLARIDAETGEARDYFRHRIMFPVRDAQGRPVGFGARTLDPEGVPKYLNSPTTPLFDKGRLLYGLDRARKAIRERDRVVLVEGYMDVLALHQAGFQEAVSVMGTALTPHHLRQLQRLTRNIYLALDPDPAGRRALWRSLEVARDAASETEPTLDAKGLLRYEQRLKVNLRVVVLPEGRDPDEIVREDPARWEALIREARPLVLFLMDLLAADLDLDDPKARAQLAETMLPLVHLVANPVEREAYLRALAERVRVPVEQLRRWRPAQPKRHRPQPSSVPRPVALPSAAPAPPEFELLPSLVYPVANVPLMERFVLGVLWQQPNLLPRVQRYLRSLGQEPLQEEDFQEEAHRQVWRLLEEVQRKFVPARAYLDQQAPQQGLQTLVETMTRLVAPLFQETEGSEGANGLPGVSISLKTSTLLREIARTILYLRVVRIAQAFRHLEDVLRTHPHPWEQDVLEQLKRLPQVRTRVEQALSKPLPLMGVGL